MPNCENCKHFVKVSYEYDEYDCELHVPKELQTISGCMCNAKTLDAIARRRQEKDEQALQRALQELELQKAFWHTGKPSKIGRYLVVIPTRSTDFFPVGFFYDIILYRGEGWDESKYIAWHEVPPYYD